MKNIMKKIMIISLILTVALPMGAWSRVNVEARETTQIQSVKISKIVLKLKVGQNRQLVLKNTDEKVTWKSKNSSIAKVGRKGVVRAKKSGKTTIIAKFGHQKYKYKVTVTAPASPKRSSGNTGRSSSGSFPGSSTNADKSNTVYWTPGGSVYHYSRSCPTLSRSRTIYSGTPSESGKSRGCKVCG